MTELVFQYAKGAARQGFTYPQTLEALCGIGVNELEAKRLTDKAFSEWNTVNNFSHTYPKYIWWSGLAMVFFLGFIVVSVYVYAITGFRVNLFWLILACFVVWVRGQRQKRLYKKESIAANYDLEKLSREILKRIAESNEKEATVSQQTRSQKEKAKPYLSKFDNEETFAKTLVAAMALMNAVDSSDNDSKKRVVQNVIKLYSEYEEMLNPIAEQITYSPDNKRAVLESLAQAGKTYSGKPRFFILKCVVRLVLENDGFTSEERSLLNEYMTSLGIAELQKEGTYKDLVNAVVREESQQST